MSKTENQEPTEFSEPPEDAFLKIEDAAKKQIEKIFFGTSESMQKAKELVARVGPKKLSVLITGETGVGKEVTAEAIHKCSPRKDKPFIAINCGAIHRESLQSELFGHVEGAYTSAVGARNGAFQQADGGTLFLDEVGDMPPEVQQALLRAVQTQKITPFGGVAIDENGKAKDEISVDVRIITATNVDIEAYIREGKFREDLYGRLKHIRIHIPPLRERREDIPHFVEVLLSECDTENRKEDPKLKPFTHITEAALDYFKNYDWPRNIRELKTVINIISSLNSKDERLLPKHVEEGFEFHNGDIKDAMPIIEPKIERHKAPPKLFDEIVKLLNTWDKQEEPLKSTNTEINWTYTKLKCLAAYYLHQQPTWKDWKQKRLLDACGVNRSTYSKFKDEFEACPDDVRLNVLACIQAAVPPENSDGE